VLPIIAALGIGAVTALPAAAQDWVDSTGQLDDDTFYKLVACAAPPGEACRKPMLRWATERPLRVKIASIDPVFLGGKQKRAKAALVRAVQYLNAVGMGISLEQVDADDEADISIYFVDTDGMSPIRDSGIKGADGAVVRGARVMVWSRRDTGEIREANILFGTRLHIRHYESAMLEEITQSLGLLTDIRNPEYDGVSIFSQDSNASKQFGEQDLMALRRHYPPS
jgi:hypothetical protein